MKSLLVSIISLLIPLSVDARAFLTGSCRRPSPDYISRCPESIKALPFDEMCGSSLEDLRSMKENFDAPEGFADMPCGGLPVDHGSVKTACPGEHVPVSWKSELSCGAKCVITLMCPGKGVNKTIWTGDCGSQPGESDVKAQVPEDAPECDSGECFFQWKMNSNEQKTYLGCVDLKISKKKPVGGIPVETEGPSEDTSPPPQESGSAPEMPPISSEQDYSSSCTSSEVQYQPSCLDQQTTQPSFFPTAAPSDVGATTVTCTETITATATITSTPPPEIHPTTFTETQVSTSVTTAFITISDVTTTTITQTITVTTSITITAAPEVKSASSEMHQMYGMPLPLSSKDLGRAYSPTASYKIKPSY